MFLELILALLTVILAFVYWNGKYNENYWKKRGVKFYNKNKVLGIFWDFITKDKSLSEHLHNIYKQYPDEPAVAFGTLMTPSLYVKDVTNVQYVLTTNFNAFSHRGFEVNKSDLLANNILLMNGKEWQLTRKSMTPLFTSTKLKSMFYIMEKSAQDFVGYLKDNPKLKKGDTFNTLSTFCSAALCGAVFGVTTESVFDSPFLKMSQKASQPTLTQTFNFTIANLSIPLFKFLNISLFKEHEPFFIRAIKQTLRQRESENVKKHDFADMCLSIQSKGMLKESETGFELEPTDEHLAAQAFFFFLAGVEPTASAMFATLVELGKHPEALQRLHEEIDAAFETNDNKLSFDVVVGMKYLDMAMSEGMRLHPPVGFLTRMCVEDTVLPVGNIKVAKGTKIFTPIFEIHHDPKYYSDPESFKPERFLRENENQISDITYQAFGKGNRICIGQRYAQLQAKTGLIYLLRNFTIKTHVTKEGAKYKKDLVALRLANVDVEFVPRT